MTAPFYTDIDKVKRYLAVNQKSDGSLQSGRDDTLIQETIDDYAPIVNDYLEWYLQTQTITDKVYTRVMSTASKIHITQDGTLVIRTNYPTIQSVTAVAYRQIWTAAWIPIDPALAVIETLDPEERPTPTSYQIRLTPQSGPWQSWRSWPQNFWVKATFDAGYASTPPPIERACTEWVANDYRLRAYIPTMSAGFIGMPMTVIKPHEIPPHIERMLRPWSRKSQ